MNATKVFLAALFLLSAAIIRGQSGEEVRAQIAAAEQKWVEMWNKRDLEGMLNLYTEDSQSFNPDSGIVKGREGMRKRYQEAFRPENHAPESATTLDVFHQGGLATETGTWKSGDEEGTYMMVWKKQEGEWKVLRETWNRTRQSRELIEPLKGLEPLLGTWAGEAEIDGGKLRVVVSWKPAGNGTSVLHEGSAWLNGEKLDDWSHFNYYQIATQTIVEAGSSRSEGHTVGTVHVLNGVIRFQNTGMNKDGMATMEVNEVALGKDAIQYSQLVIYNNGKPREDLASDFELKRQ